MSIMYLSHYMVSTRSSIVTIGLDASPPVPMHTGHPGVGFEVDLVKAMAVRVGFVVRYESALWNDIVQRLVDGELDMICSAATITAERKRLVDFSLPYLSFQLAIVVGAGERAVRRASDLAGKAIGVRIATTAERFVRDSISPRSIRTYHFNTEAYAALSSREVDTVVDDHPIASGFASLMPTLRVAASIPRTRSHYGIMFAKGNNGLRKAVNGALRDIRRDGTHAALARKWFPGDRVTRALADSRSPV